MKSVAIAPTKVHEPLLRRGVLCTAVFFLCVAPVLADAGGAGIYDATCRDVEQAASAQLAAGGDAAALLDQAVESAGPTCVGEILLEIAEKASVEGRTTDVAHDAERSLKLLEVEHAPDDPIMVRPLALAWAANFELQNRAKSRSILDRMRRISAKDPDDRALVHTVSARVLRSEGKLREAEEEMRAAIVDAEADGRANTADKMWVLHQLACVYIDEKRYDAARATTDQAAAVLNSAKDAVPIDYLRMLELAGIIDARQGRWADAECKLAKAVAIAERIPGMQADAIRELLATYAAAMRKNGHGRAAKAVDRRLASLPSDRIVDVGQLTRENAR